MTEKELYTKLKRPVGVFPQHCLTTEVASDLLICIIFQALNGFGNYRNSRVNEKYRKGYLAGLIIEDFSCGLVPCRRSA